MSPVFILTSHADYVTGTSRRCTCGNWCDETPQAQKTRGSFVHHQLTELARNGWMVAHKDVVA